MLDYAGAETLDEPMRHRNLVVAPQAAMLDRICFKSGQTDHLKQYAMPAVKFPLWWWPMQIVGFVGLVLLFVRFGRQLSQGQIIAVYIGAWVGFNYGYRALAKQVARPAILDLFLTAGRASFYRWAALVAKVLRWALLIYFIGEALVFDLNLPLWLNFFLLPLYFAVLLMERRLKPARLKRVTAATAIWAGAGQAYLQTLPKLSESQARALGLKAN